LTPCERTAAQLDAIARGGYVLVECAQPQVVLVATGSEVEVALAAARQLALQGLPCASCRCPASRCFYAQDAAYRNAVLPPGVPRVSVEAGSHLVLARGRGRQGHGDRHRQLWRIGAGATTVRAFRPDGRAGGQCAPWRSSGLRDGPLVQGQRPPRS
jgi:hypothetical protein